MSTTMTLTSLVEQHATTSLTTVDAAAPAPAATATATDTDTAVIKIQCAIRIFCARNKKDELYIRHIKSKAKILKKIRKKEKKKQILNHNVIIIQKRIRGYIIRRRCHHDRCHHDRRHRRHRDEKNREERIVLRQSIDALEKQISDINNNNNNKQGKKKKKKKKNNNNVKGEQSIFLCIESLQSEYRSIMIQNKTLYGVLKPLKKNLNALIKKNEKIKNEFLNIHTKNELLRVKNKQSLILYKDTIQKTKNTKKELNELLSTSTIEITVRERMDVQRRLFNSIEFILNNYSGDEKLIDAITRIGQQAQLESKEQERQAAGAGVVAPIQSNLVEKIGVAASTSTSTLPKKKTPIIDIDIDIDSDGGGGGGGGGGTNNTNSAGNSPSSNKGRVVAYKKQQSIADNDDVCVLSTTSIRTPTSTSKKNVANIDGNTTPAGSSSNSTRTSRGSRSRSSTPSSSTSRQKQKQQQSTPTSNRTKKGRNKKREAMRNNLLSDGSIGTPLISGNDLEKGKEKESPVQVVSNTNDSTAKPLKPPSLSKKIPKPLAGDGDDTNTTSVATVKTTSAMMMTKIKSPSLTHNLTATPDSSKYNRNRNYRLHSSSGRTKILTDSAKARRKKVTAALLESDGNSSNSNSTKSPGLVSETTGTMTTPNSSKYRPKFRPRVSSGRTKSLTESAKGRRKKVTAAILEGGGNSSGSIKFSELESETNPTTVSSPSFAMNNNANDPTSSSRSNSDSAKRRGRRKTVAQKAASCSIRSPGLLLLVTSRSNRSRDNDDDREWRTKKKERSSGETESNNNKTKKSSSDKGKKKKNNNNKNKKKPSRSSIMPLQLSPDGNVHPLII
jgi:hypothetical protein